MRLSIQHKFTGTYLIVLFILMILSGYAFHMIKKIVIREVAQSSLLVARQVFRRMDHRLYHLMMELKIQTLEPVFMDEIARSNEAFDAMENPDALIAARQAAWGGPEALSVKQAVAGNAPSLCLQKRYITHFTWRYGYALIDNVVLTNRYGAVVAMAADEQRYDHRNTVWWKTAQTRGRFLDGVYREGAAWLELAHAVTDSRGQVVGALLLRLNIRELIREAEVGVRQYYGTQIQIVTDQGRLLYATTPHQYLADVRLSEPFYRVVGDEGYFVSGPGGRRLNSFTRSRGGTFLEKGDWYLIISHRMADVLAAYRVFYFAFIGIGFFVGAFTLILVIMVGVKVTSPLKALMNAIHSLGQGGYGKPLKVKSQDEFGDLARAFDSMVRRRRFMEEDLHFAGFAMDHASDMAMWLTPDGYIYYANEAACVSLGYDKSTLLGMYVGSVDGRLSKKAWETHWREVKQKKSLILERGLSTAEGGTLPVEVVVNHMAFRGREYLCAFARDITERLSAENDRQEMEQRLRQAQKMEAIGTLAGGIAHDFNNILSLILGYAELALEKLSDRDGASEDIQEVVKAGHRARDLVAQILAFSRQAESKYIPFQPASIVKEGLKMLRASLPSTITIRESIDPGCGVIVADPTEMNQVLINLCANAFHAMEKAGGILEVDLRNITLDRSDIAVGAELRPGEYVRLKIRDTGPGIPVEIQERIFEPYFTTKGVGRGTGIGLAIVHGIMKRCGGAVYVKSRLGAGATFRLFFPVSSKALIQRGAHEQEVPRGSEHILFVDDEPYLAELGKEMFEHLGYRVTIACESTRAWTLFQENADAFDLVITDQTMPGMTGDVLAAHILRMKPGFPIILCTGYSSLVSEETARAMGIRAFILKPFVKSKMAVLIRQVLKGA